MPALTPNFEYPYPLPADSINVPRDMQALAERLDKVSFSLSPRLVMNGVDQYNWLLADGGTRVLTTSLGGDVNIGYAHPFAYTPGVVVVTSEPGFPMVGIQQSSGTPTGAVFRVYWMADAVPVVSTSIRVSWIALGFRTPEIDV